MIKNELIKRMVDRFLGWKLPPDFHPDCGIHFDAEAAIKMNPRNSRYEPIGTNLFTADQAKAMIEHMLDNELCDLALRAAEGEREANPVAWRTWYDGWNYADTNVTGAMEPLYTRPSPDIAGRSKLIADLRERAKWERDASDMYGSEELAKLLDEAARALEGK